MLAAAAALCCGGLRKSCRRGTRMVSTRSALLLCSYRAPMPPIVWAPLEPWEQPLVNEALRAAATRPIQARVVLMAVGETRPVKPPRVCPRKEPWIVEAQRAAEALAEAEPPVAWTPRTGATRVQTPSDLAELAAATRSLGLRTRNAIIFVGVAP